MINRNRQILALMLNVLIFALEIIGMILSFIEYGDGSFEYYTQDSNYLATIASAVFIPFAIMALCGKKPMPRWVVSLRHMATACLALTFFVVLFVLIPMDGLSSCLGCSLAAPTSTTIFCVLCLRCCHSSRSRPNPPFQSAASLPA